MKTTGTLAAMLCLLAGVTLWMLGHVVPGIALAVSSAVLILAISVIDNPEKPNDNSRLENWLDLGLILAGLAAFTITKDAFFITSAAIVVVTNPGIRKFWRQPQGSDQR